MATILSINCNLDASLRQLGHTVYSISIQQGGVYSAQEYVQQCPTMPDIFLQKEHLGQNIFFSDVHTLPCATAHWGIDSHLRYWWQRHYAALFDVFFTPHKAFLQRLSPEWLHPHMYRLAQPAPKRAFIPHAQRKHALNFVGRLSGTRPQRKLLCQVLRQRYGVAHIDGISFAQMMDLYNDTCIIPNESIAQEVNFRLMEGCACGCALISPHVGADQDALFEPNREILVYTSMEELTAHVDRCLHDSSFAEKMGRRAWIRVQKEHLILHRAEAFMQGMEAFMEAASSHREQKYMPARRHMPHNEQVFAFTMGLMALYDMQKAYEEETLWQKLTPTPSLVLILRIFFTFKKMKQKTLSTQEGKERIYAFLEQANAVLMAGACHTSYKKMLAVAAAGAALYFDDAARGSFYLHLYEKIQFPEKTSSVRKSLMGAENTIDVAMNWVFTLRRDQKQCFGGFDYMQGCCFTALDFVSLCRDISPLDMRWAAAMTSLEHVMTIFPHETLHKVQEAIQN